MTKIITQLSDPFAKALKAADEIWVAVGLMNEQGLNFITDQIPTNCKQNYLVGIDLPSHPKALTKLFKKHSAMECLAKVYIDKKHFSHPKLYLIKTKNQFTAFVGLANCTSCVGLLSVLRSRIEPCLL